MKIISPLELEQLAEKQLLEIIITVRTEQVVRKIKSWLGHLPNSIIYTFNEFIEEWKPNCNLRRFSCVMFHLTDHCNLSCVRCSHFSPLAKSSFFIDVHLFERDCCRLAELTGGDVDEIQLSGGEPLLHPEVEKFPYIVRKYFPKTKIIIITNATRLKFMKNSFFQACVENKVEVWISQYPINLPYEEIEKIDVVEPDRVFVEVCKEFFPDHACGLVDKRVSIYYEDGLKFLRLKQNEYDLIINDAIDPLGHNAGLFTKEFYGNCYRALKEDGIMVYQHGSPFYDEDEESCRVMHRKASHSFPISRVYQAHIPTCSSGYWLFGFASKKYHPLEHLDAKRWKERHIKTWYYTTNLHKGAFMLPRYVEDMLEEEEDRKK